MNKHIKNSNSNGFTIVETLVAVTILMIAVAGPLVVASKGLTASLYARDQLAASYLAQESMELIKNIRDNNIENDSNDTYPDWLEGLDECSQSDPCDATAVEAALDPDFIGVYDCPSTGCQLYATGNGYSPVGSSVSIFKRLFYLEEPDPDTDPDTIESEAEEVRVTVEVHWDHGLVQNFVRISSMLHRDLR